MQGKAAAKRKRKRKAVDSTDESEEELPSDLTVSADLVSEKADLDGLEDGEDAAPESKPAAVSSEPIPGEGHT